MFDPQIFDMVHWFGWYYFKLKSLRPWGHICSTGELSVIWLTLFWPVSTNQNIRSVSVSQFQGFRLRLLFLITDPWSSSLPERGETLDNTLRHFLPSAMFFR